MMHAVSTYRPLKHYKWGNDCDGWNLVDNKDLSIKQERMAPGSFEQLHYHVHAQQFFYILKGIARIHIADHLVDLQAGEGLHIEAGTKHFIINHGTGDLDFLVCSSPSTNTDRVNCI